MLTRCFAALSLLAMNSATQSDIPASSNPAIVKVECLTSSGSAFRVGAHALASVAHVTSAGGCFIGNKPFEVIGTKGDFTILKMKAPAPNWLKIDCGGFIEGRHYIATGYARGLDTQASVDLVATGQKSGQFSILAGVFTVVPGMSGGSVIDAETGKVVGSINVFMEPQGLSGSVALKETPLCRG